MSNLKQAAFILLLFTVSAVNAQTINPSLLTRQWNARWITVPGKDLNYEVCSFRKTLDLQQKPTKFVVHVSGDNRYKLYVNGTLVSIGPARGDLYYWNYETVDLAPYLSAGKNVVAASVWNEDVFRPVAQVSFRTGFILQGDGSAEEVLNTGTGWKCVRDSAYKPIPVVTIYSYYVAGPGEMVDMKNHSQQWKLASFDDSNWPQASPISPGVPKGIFTYNDGWMLVPSPIQARELTTERFNAVRKADGVQVPASFPKDKAPVTVPAHTKATIILDQAYLTNAFPTLLFSKGKDAGISLTYTEAPYVIEPGSSNWRAQGQKGNRNEIEGKRIVGRKDSLISDGTTGQEFTPLNFRTYRYIKLIAETKDEPLVIDDIYSTFTGYPFKYNVKFNAGEPELNRILYIGWHTARLCAWETYMDCPYYEQLQYIGDTRIQALVSYYNSGNDTLARYAISSLDHSRLAEGITQSRYPTAVPQQIPTFSLWWIGMLHDYWIYRPDKKFVQDKLVGERAVLDFFRRYQQQDGSLKNLPYWTFTDWSEGKGWANGMAPRGADGTSAVLDLQLLWALQLASEMETSMGSQEYAAKYKAAALQLKETIRKKYWVAAKGLFADKPEKDVFSQHTNALAILTGVSEAKDNAAIGHKLLTDTSLIQASIYFKYYVHLALVKAGLGNDYLNWLGIWRDNIKMGMTTWAEMSDVNRTRSDCHAWGSSPNIEFFRTVLGIESAAPGFSKVKIEPHLGKLESVGGEMPHPNGKVSVTYVFVNNRWLMKVILPANTPGTFLWKGKQYPLKAGENNLTVL